MYEQGETAFRLAQGTALVLDVVLPAKGAGRASLVAEAPDGTRTPIASCGRHQAEYVEWLDELARAIGIAADLAPLRVEVSYDA